MWYSFVVVYIAGKNLLTADALSRASQACITQADREFVDVIEYHIDAIIQTSPSSNQKLEQIKKATKMIIYVKKLVEFCLNGWPKHVKYNLVGYFCKAANIAYKNGLLLNGNRILIPTALQGEMFKRIHAGHQGISKCRERAYW